MIFFESFKTRIEHWVKFRQELETLSNPIDRTIEFWNKAPISPLSCDPFDKSTWLGPWDLIEENTYCEFSKILAIYYTLSLTDLFRNSYFEIQIVNDRDAHELKYLLVVDQFVVGFLYDKSILRSELPKDLNIQASYPMLMAN